MIDYKHQLLSSRQHVFHGDNFEGYSLQPQCSPYVVEYLSRLKNLLGCTLDEYPSVFVLRIDLKVPHDMTIAPGVIERFIASLRAQIKHRQNLRRRSEARVHTTSVRYVWCKEFTQADNLHYHVALLFNKQSYCRAGSYVLEASNLYSTIVTAWLRALNLEVQERYKYLVHFSAKGEYIMRRDDPQSIDQVFYRLSYLCKLASKRRGSGSHSFGCSRG